MANNKPCVVRGLPEDIRATVDDQISKGISAPSISRWLVKQGFKVTPRQLNNYKERTAPRVTLNTSQDSFYTPSDSECQLMRSARDMLLSNANELNNSFKNTGDLRTARLLIEMTEAAMGIAKFLVVNNPPDTHYDVSVIMKPLEAELGIPEADLSQWRNDGGDFIHFRDDGGDGGGVPNQ